LAAVRACCLQQLQSTRCCSAGCVVRMHSHHNSGCPGYRPDQQRSSSKSKIKVFFKPQKTFGISVSAFRQTPVIRPTDSTSCMFYEAALRGVPVDFPAYTDFQAYPLRDGQTEMIRVSLAGCRISYHTRHLRRFGLDALTFFALFG